MKPIHSGISPKQSCSCSSCLYRSESDRPSLRNIIDHGSKIDKLYYGKYIPLRERELLGKLVRTRAVYDDIRNQLLSGSSINLGKADLKPRKETFTTKPNRDTQKVGDIPTLVDFVDKGNIFLPENSSECCSCCICGSILNLDDNMHKNHMLKHKRHVRAQMTSKSSVISRDRTGELTKLGRGVHFKTKHIRSDPCTCTYKFSDTIRRHAKSVLKKTQKNRPVPVIESLVGAPEQINSKKQKTIKASIEKVKQTKSRLVKGMQENTRNSVTKLIDAKSKVKENIVDLAKKTSEKIQETNKKIQKKADANKYGPEYILPTENITEEKFKITKDSLTKFRDTLRKKHDMKEWECDIECQLRKCVPKECFRIIKRRRLRKIKDANVRHESTRDDRREKNVGGKPKVSDISIEPMKYTEAGKHTSRKTDTEKTHIKLDRSCVCFEIKKKHINRKQKRITHGKHTTKSKTSVIRKPSEVSSRAMPAQHIYEENLKIPKQSRTGVKMDNADKIRNGMEERKKAHISQNARQAVRVGSSFSFNIEFYKDRSAVGKPDMRTRPDTRSIIKDKQLTSRDGNSIPKIVQKSDKSSENTLNQSVKNIQAVGHPLKRCFCTLKLKPRKTKTTLNAYKMRYKKCICPCTSPHIVQTKIESVTETIQTNKVPELLYVLEPYECKQICIPGKCDPIECEKRIQKRNKKRRSVSIYTNKTDNLKTASNIISGSTSSAISKGLQMQSIGESVTHTQRESLQSIAPVVKFSSPHRQVVRIGSTFSFQVEFSKDRGHTNSPIVPDAILNTKTYSSPNQMVVEKPRTDKGVPKAKRYIRHKYSQISSSTKTKITSQKHKLRRCFCTLKFNKNEKKNKSMFVSKATITSSQSMIIVAEPQPAVKTVSMVTKKAKKNIIFEPQLFPYECEPGVCTPGTCDPYECFEFIKRREVKVFRTKKSSTPSKNYRKTKSTSSVAPKSRTNKVQSTLVAYKEIIPSSISSGKKSSLKQLKESHKKTNKQAVRIGSSFSFNVEFYKVKPVKDDPVEVKQQPQNLFRREITDPSSHIAYVTKRKSILVQAVSKRKNAAIGSAIKRCFCTLKLQKPVKESKNDTISIGTKTPKFLNNQFSQLEPYECESYVCTPGECNRYDCLEKIKKRNARFHFKEMGVIAQPSKMKSTSSSPQSARYTIKDTYAQSKWEEQNILTKKGIQEKRSLKSEHIPNTQKIYTRNQPNQSVRLGSNFSFKIEFSQNRKCNEDTNAQISEEREDVKRSKLLKNQGEQPFTSAIRQNAAQVNVIKKTSRAIGVAPILKRCFCTLQLQKKINRPIKSSIQVYTVSRVGVATPTFTHKQLASDKVISVNEIDRYRTGYINKTATTEDYKFCSCNISCSSCTVQFNSEILFSCNGYDSMYDRSVMGPIYSQPIFGVNSKCLKNDVKCVKPPKVVRSLCMKNPLQTRRITKASEISLQKYNKFYAAKQYPNEVSAYLRRQFCAMNIQIDKYGFSPMRHKLKPYECEAGICIPFKCDPLVCQERIKRRLMRMTSKTSGTQKHIHSASNSTINTRHRSKRLQSNLLIAPSRRKQSHSTIKQKIVHHTGKKQTVRVGSNFSFNIEFRKDNMQPPNIVKDSTYYPPKNIFKKTTDKSLRHKGTKDYPKHQADRESQSNVEMEHRGSNATPLLQRCFCTLKLHKEGRRENKKLSTNDKKITAIMDAVTVSNVDSTQNTGTHKFRKFNYNLEPYECEPGVCVPEQCDPYECSELIKRRNKHKDFGTKMMKSGKISSASMTSTKKRKIKNRCNQLNCKETGQPVQKYEKSEKTLNYTKPSRHAVRLGSSFSFSLELFKENPDLQTRPILTSKSIIYQPDKKVRVPRRTRDFKEQFSQDIRSMQHKDSQSDSIQDKKSTTTSSFIKRCFCTATLHRKEKKMFYTRDKTTNVKIKKQSSASLSFLQRCVCVMKSLTHTKFKKGTPSQTGRESTPKYSYGPALHELEPYECTPGACIPGECDPYICDQLIRKRNAKSCNKETCIRKPRTRSQSSRNPYCKTPRVKQTQMTVDTSSKIIKPTSSGDFERRYYANTSEPPKRQVVRIGSNFNFNVEFYKDRQSIQMFNNKSLTEHHKKERSIYDHSKVSRPDTRSRASCHRKKHKHNRDSQVQDVKKQHTASGVGRLLQRCFCTLNLQKARVPKRFSATDTQSMREAIASESPNINTKGVMTVNKPFQYKLDPYECEPNTCIPGRCDPSDCEKRLKKRLRREYGTSTVQSKTKSATSMASSARKLRHMKIQSRSKTARRNRTGIDQPGKSAYKIIDPTNRSSRQAVRLGSTFSLNVEFSKAKGNDKNISYPPEITQYNDITSKRNYRKRASVPCNTKTCQANTRTREVDSQVFTKKMRSTMSGVTPFLKRCFCTLKLQNPIARSDHDNTDNQTRPRAGTGNKSTYTAKKFKEQLTPIRTQHLHSYECEPGVCVPGACNPYECEKRIKMREIGRNSESSNTDNIRDSSKYVSARHEHTDRRSHGTSIPYKSQKQKVGMSDIPRAVVREPNMQPAHSPHRQAVRIGSNFNFDIKFYKDKSGNGLPKETYPQTVAYKTDRVSSLNKSSKPSTRNAEEYNRGISFHHRKSQAYGPKTETTGSGVGPFLKRCFCTLKLHKQGKREIQPSARVQADYNAQPSSHDASTVTKKKQRDLEPYECEPNVCVPGFCDPYECLRRLKHRKMKELGVVTDKTPRRTDYSLTSKRATKDRSLKTKYINESTSKKNVSFEKKPHHKVPRRSFAKLDSRRQAVRIGSSFNFDVEFYKQSSEQNDQSHGDGQTFDSDTTKAHHERRRKLKSLGSQGKCTSNCKGIQVKGTQRHTIGSGPTPLLKRCFCTLALQNNPKYLTVQQNTNPMEEAKSKDMCTQSKCDFQKSRSLPYSLEPYECEPNVCVPGECNPYDCYERIKLRNARYKSKGFGTDTKQYSQVSSMTMGYGKFSKSKRTQSVLLGRKRRHRRSSSANQSMIVEQPRLQMLSDIANRNLVKIGSEISFNIEFYKEVTPAAVEIDYANRSRNNVGATVIKHKNTYKTTFHRSRNSQAQTLRAQDKGSLVSNALKRCFCTAYLHKPNVTTPKSDLKRKCVECKPQSIFKPQQYQVYYHKASLKKKPTQRCVCTTCDDNICQNTKGTSTKPKGGIKLKPRSAKKSKKIQNVNEMETILPYAPNKFNKKASKTLFANNNGTSGEDGGYCTKMQCPKWTKGTITKNQRLKKSKSSKKINVDKTKNGKPENKGVLTLKGSNLNSKSLFCRCKELFTKKKNIKNNVAEPDKYTDMCLLSKSENIKKELAFKEGEKLKETKSERRATKTFIKEPKKSKSLKIKNYVHLEPVRQDYSEFQSGDTKNKKRKRLASNKRKSKNLSGDYETNQLHCGDDYLYLYVSDLDKKLTKDNKKQVKFSELKNDGIVASVNLTPKSGRKNKLSSKTKVNKKRAQDLVPMKAHCQADPGSYLDIVLQPSYCSGTKLEGIATVSFKGDSKLKTKSSTKRKSITKKHPLKEAHSTCSPGTCEKKTIDFENKSRAMQPRKSIIKKHLSNGKNALCSPGICEKKTINPGDTVIEMQPGASFRIPAKSSRKQTADAKCDIDRIIDTLTKNINAIKNAKSRVLNTLITKEQICSCYSSVCECAKAIRKEKERAQEIEMKLEIEKCMLKEQKRMRKEEAKEAKQKQKEFWSRQKRYQREDAMRRRKRLKENKLLAHRLKNVKTSDVLLAADSVLDIAKLGCTVVGNVARSTSRFVRDPAYTCHKMKHAAADPTSMIKNAIDDTGLAATLKRVFMRITAMKGIKTMKGSLEENQFTGYLMKMAENDPRKRMQLKKKKAKKKKGPAIDDFECSLYMASLRKKRFIAVYYLCPWFYPHFITLLNVVRQVTDLILFLLAVFVWSPCILCMELCRAFVCCFFCTG